METISELPVASQFERISAANERWLSMRALIAARGARLRAGFTEVADEVGTGLLVHTVRRVGPDNVDEFELDSDLIRAMRDIEESVAKQIGQWAESDDDAPMKTLLNVVLDRV